MPETRRTFTILAQADRVYGCSRCHRKLVAGTRVTIIQHGSLVEVRHAGRVCPPTYKQRPL